MAILYLRASIIGLAGLWLASCSSVDLGNAKQLGQAGGTTFTEFADAYATTGKQMSRYKEASTLRGALAPVPAGMPPSATQLVVDRKQVDIVVEEMVARAGAMRAFVRAYKAFEDLAAYDAAGEMDQALSGLGDAIAVFAAAVGSPIAAPVAKVGTAVIASLGGAIAGEVQRSRVKAASEAIRGNLEAFKKIHEFALEQKAVVDTRRRLFNAQFDVASGLWMRGALSANKYVADWASVSGLNAVDEKTQPITAKTFPDLARPIYVAIRQQRDAQRDAIEQAYADTDGTVDELIKAHKKLENGNPIDISELRARVAKLNALFVRLHTAATATAN